MTDVRLCISTKENKKKYINLPVLNNLRGHWNTDFVVYGVHCQLQHSQGWGRVHHFVKHNCIKDVITWACGPLSVDAVHLQMIFCLVFGIRVLISGQQCLTSNVLVFIVFPCLTVKKM